MDKTAPKPKQPEKPNIFRFYDYREYLKALFAWCKATIPVFSHRYIVAKAGFTSPNALKNVMDGKRNLAPEAAERYAKAFKLSASERRYFVILVRFTRAAGMAERETFLKDLLALRSVEDPARLGEDHFDVLSQWWHLAIREIVALPDFRDSEAWVSASLRPNITPKAAAESLDLLKRLGLIERTAEGWAPAEAMLATDAHVRSVLAARFHREMIRLGSESMARFPAPEREISGTTLRMGAKEFAALKDLLREFRIKALNLAKSSGNADRVYQLNFQLFPLVASPAERESPRSPR